MSELETEGPTTGESEAAGGVDLARDAARAAEGESPSETQEAEGDTPVETPEADTVKEDPETTPGNETPEEETAQ